MKINAFLIRFAMLMMMIFGGIFTIRYFRTGELLLDQLIGSVVGFILLLAALIWRKWNK